MSKNNDYSLGRAISSALIIFMLAIVVIMIGCAFSRNTPSQNNTCKFFNHILDKAKNFAEFNVVTKGVVQALIGVAGVVAPIWAAQQNSKILLNNVKNNVKTAEDAIKENSPQEVEDALKNADESATELQKVAKNAAEEGGTEAAEALKEGTRVAAKAKGLVQAMQGNTRRAVNTMKEAGVGAQEATNIVNTGKTVFNNVKAAAEEGGTETAEAAAEAAAEALSEGGKVIEGLIKAAEDVA